MKNTIKTILSGLALSTILFSCQKEIDSPSTVAVGDLVPVTFSAKVGPVTKVSLTPNGEDTAFTSAWENGDGMKLYYLNDNSEGSTVDATYDATYSKWNATLPSYNGEWYYVASYPVASDIPFGAARTQTGDAYNPAYDIMQGEVNVLSGDAGKDDKGNDIVFPMERFTAIQYFHFTSDLDEKVYKATLSVGATDDYIAATTVNISAGALAVATGGSNSITITFPTGSEPNASDFKLWFNVLPATFTEMTIDIETASHKKHIERTISGGINEYEAGKLYKVVGKVSSWETVYTLVESQNDLFDGATYIIAGSDVDYAVGLYTGGNNHPAIAVEKSTNAQGKSIITIDNNVNVEPLLIEKTGTNWTIKNNASGNSYFGQYLICATGDYNRLKETDSESSALKDWTISISDGVATIINANTEADRTRLYYNANTGGASPLFACYATNQSASNYHNVALYVDLTTCAVLPDPELSFSPTSVNVNWDDKESFVKPTLDNPHSVTVTYSSSNENVAEVDANTGDITFVGNGTTTITASSAKTAEYKAGTASYSITVSGKPANDYVTLDWSFPGGTSSDLNNETGVTTSGLGDDYAVGNAPYRIKFDTSGDYIMVKTDVSIGDVSVDYKMIGGAITSSITFSESSDGENWTDVQTLSIAGLQNSIGTLTTTNTFNSASRFVKMTFTKGSNVGIGGIRIRHEAPATVATPTFSVTAGT